MVVLKQLSTLQELCLDLLLVRMEAQREGVEGGDWSGTSKCQDDVLITGISKLVTVPIDLLRIDSITRTVFRMFVVISVGELAAAMTIPFIAVQCSAWLKDGPEVLERDDLVLDIVCLCCNRVSQLCFEDCV